MNAKPPDKTIPASPSHEREWLDCLRSRKQPSCSVSYHYTIDVAIVLANLSMKVGRALHFDPQNGTNCGRLPGWPNPNTETRGTSRISI